MDTEENKQEGQTTPEEGQGEGGEGQQEEVVTLKKGDYDKLNQTLGSLKREIKDLKKSKEEPQEKTPEKTEPDNSKVQERVDRLALKAAGVTHPDDIELAQKTAKKWGVDIDELLDDADFKVKLERQQADRANVEATSDVKGSGNKPGNAKNTTEYWEKKGVPPTPADVPDGPTRRKIIKELRKQADGGGKMPFYNS